MLNNSKGDDSEGRPPVDNSTSRKTHNDSTTTSTRQSTSTGTLQELEQITGESAATLLLDRQRCFEVFRKSIRRTETLTENKELLRKLCEEAKRLGKEANDAREVVNKEKSKIEKIRKKAMVLGHEGDRMPEDCAVEIQMCTSEIEKQTATYKGCADKLRGVRNDIERIQQMMEQSRKRLQKDFEKWYSSIRRQVDVASITNEDKKEMLEEDIRKYDAAKESIMEVASELGIGQ
ncbi:hypothetical protein FOL47_003906 [Perkinsus chesapeaki]|uniref:Kinesin-like protein KIF6/9 C-terminal domain-containing protein n=1 Tax=Perkinsus chesapeaki TaxID=330153 RepID=A0A7J6M5S3_PERCH|nr:hypothetical protein FOL47_003906 [Perkinsus chesapeaki]